MDCHKQCLLFQSNIGITTTSVHLHHEIESIKQITYGLVCVCVHVCVCVIHSHEYLMISLRNPLVVFHTFSAFHFRKVLFTKVSVNSFVLPPTP
eukprot:m.60211 g.60211  ORF g.60211 m.60211 type:complete len:94 (+) comp11359_c0_seq1:1477-1758(+)